MGRKEIKMKRLCLNTIPLTSISKNPSLGLILAPRILCRNKGCFTIIPLNYDNKVLKIINWIC